MLVAAAERLEATRGTPFLDHELAGAVGLDRADAAYVLDALMPTHLRGADQSDFGGANIIVTGLTDEGRRAVGLWPDREDHLASLLAALTSAEEQTDDAKERTMLRTARDGLARVPAAVLTSWLSGQIG